MVICCMSVSYTSIVRELGIVTELYTVLLLLPVLLYTAILDSELLLHGTIDLSMLHSTPSIIIKCYTIVQTTCVLSY